MDTLNAIERNAVEKAIEKAEAEHSTRVVLSTRASRILFDGADEIGELAGLREQVRTLEHEVGRLKEIAYAD